MIHATDRLSKSVYLISGTPPLSERSATKPGTIRLTKGNRYPEEISLRLIMTANTGIPSKRKPILIKIEGRKELTVDRLHAASGIVT